jgi:hypothetical protein
LFVIAATVAALLLAAGCGSSSNGSSSDEVTVQTGSLSKAEFAKKADAICKAARTEFLAKYTSFFKAHESEFGNAKEQKALLGELVETLLVPNIEGEVKQIGELGAPKAYAPEVASFLDALQKRLGEARDEPTVLTATATPFEKAERAAAKAEMQGCSESFS